MGIRELIINITMKTLKKAISWLEGITFVKVTAVTITACFLFSFVFADTLRATVVNPENHGKINQILSDFYLPANVGRITDGRNFGTQDVVVNIQDLHCNSEVQKKISKILELLDKRFGLGSVYIEGASSVLNTSWLDGVKDEELRKQTMELLLEKGMLSGSEYYSMKNNKAHFLKGIENSRIHKENIVRLGTIIEKQKYFESSLAGLRSDLSFLKSKYFKSKNRKFSRLLERQAKREFTTEKYYTLLEKYAQKINEHPKEFNNNLMISWSDYPNISGYLELLALSKKLDYPKISRQMQYLIAELRQKLPYSTYVKMQEKTNNFSNLEVLYSLLSDISKNVLADFTSKYAETSRFFEYVKKVKTINPIEMITEEKRLVGQIRLGLSDDIAEFEVSFLSEFFEYFANYLTNKLSTADYEYFSKRFATFRQKWAAYTYENRLEALAPDFPLLDEFYSVNNERSGIFIENIFKDEHISQSGKSETQGVNSISYPLSDKKVVVVITGGFHSVELQKLLDKQGISHLTITPDITRGCESSNAIYRELVLQQSKILTSAIDILKMSENVRVQVTGNKVNIEVFGENFIIEKGKNELIRVNGPSALSKGNNEITSFISFVNQSIKLLPDLLHISAKELILFFIENIAKYNFTAIGEPLHEITGS